MDLDNHAWDNFGGHSLLIKDIRRRYLRPTSRSLALRIIDHYHKLLTAICHPAQLIAYIDLWTLLSASHNHAALFFRPHGYPGLYIKCTSQCSSLSSICTYQHC